MGKRRLTCPECGSSDLIRHDDYHWVCKNCGAPFTVSEVNGPDRR